MTTGLLIRDFTKEYRELRYENSGSIRLSEIEHNAYRIALTVEVTHINAPRYENTKTLPNNTHYGYLTTFKGSSILDSQALKFPKTRVIEILNQGIWNYHQATESLSLPLIALGNQVARYAYRLGAFLASAADPDFIWEVPGYTLLDSVGDLPVLDLVFPDYEGIDAAQNADGEPYRAFPVASPFPDVIKFKSDIPCSFLFRLETWYLVNPLVYVVDNPTDTGDATEGEDEYPEPDTSGNFPDPSATDPDSDPRDSTGGADSAIPFEGGQCSGVLYYVNILREATVSPPTTTVQYTVAGPVKGIRVSSSTAGNDVVRSYFLRHGSPETEVALGALFVTLTEGNPPVVVQNNPNMTILNVSRVDGEPDNCGNPLPILI